MATEPVAPVTLADMLLAVVVERGHQDAKWGVQNHAPTKWVAIIAEELGEVSQQALAIESRGYWTEVDDVQRKAIDDAYVSELVQVAASALAAAECFRRERWRVPR